MWTLRDLCDSCSLWAPTVIRETLGCIVPSQTCADYETYQTQGPRRGVQTALIGKLGTEPTWRRCCSQERSSAEATSRGFAVLSVAAGLVRS